MIEKPTKDIIVTGFHVTETLRGICQYACKHGWHLRMHTISSARQRLPGNLNRGDGVVFIHNPHPQELERLLPNTRVPIVHIASARKAVGLPRVWHDDYAIGRMGANYFIENHYKDVAYLTPKNVRRLHDLVWQGAEDRLRRSSCKLIPVRPDSMETLAQCRKPAGLLTIDGPWGIFMFNRLRTWGVPIPESIAVLASGIPGWGNSFPVPLSYIDTNEVEVGKRACQLLNDLVDGAQPPAKPILIPPARVVASASTGVPAIDNPSVRKAVEVLQRDYREAINFEQVARSVGVCRYRLDQAFKCELDLTMHGYLARYRIRQAEVLLQDRQIPIAQIAQQIGFASHANFIRAFRKIHRTTPRQFRNTAMG